MVIPPGNGNHMLRFFRAYGAGNNFQMKMKKIGSVFFGRRLFRSSFSVVFFVSKITNSFDDVIGSYRFRLFLSSFFIAVFVVCVEIYE